jgi:hypothetical protein
MNPSLELVYFTEHGSGPALLLIHDLMRRRDIRTWACSGASPEFSSVGGHAQTEHMLPHHLEI